MLADRPPGTAPWRSGNRFQQLVCFLIVCTLFPVTFAINPPELRHDDYYYFAAEVEGHEWMADAELGQKAHAIARHVGASLVGPVGHVRGHYLLQHKRDRHPSLHARRYDAHDDIRWASLQVPQKRLFKRTPYTAEQVEKMWDKLGIHDPGASHQWHLVRSRYETLTRSSLTRRTLQTI